MDKIAEVLVPTDFSAASWQAVLAGIKLVKPENAHLHILHVTTFDDAGYNVMIKEKLENLSENLGELYNVSITGTLLIGDMDNEVKNFTEAMNIDVVVVGRSTDQSKTTDDFTHLSSILDIPVMIVPPITVQKKTFEGGVIPEFH